MCGKDAIRHNFDFTCNACGHSWVYDPDAHSDGEDMRKNALGIEASSENYAKTAEGIFNDPRLDREGKLLGLTMLFDEAREVFLNLRCGKCGTYNRSDNTHCYHCGDRLCYLPQAMNYELLAALKIAAKGCLRPDIYPEGSDESEQILNTIAYAQGDVEKAKCELCGQVIGKQQFTPIAPGLLVYHSDCIRRVTKGLSPSAQGSGIHESQAPSDT
jgi:ribosomal protein S27E